MNDTGASGLERPTIVTSRLLLRLPEIRDADAVVEIVVNREVAHRLSRVPHPYGLADAEFFIKQVVPNEWVWAITLRGADEMVGAVGLTPNCSGRTAELGYWLSSAHWGCGIVTEAAKAVVEFGFGTLALPYITSGYFVENPASGRVLEKLGFAETGRGTRPCLAEGGNVSAVDMRLEPPA